MPKNVRHAQVLGAIAVAGACGLGVSLGHGDASLVREAAAAPTVPPPPPGGGGTMPPTYVAPRTGIIDTAVPSSAQVSYQVVSSSADVTTANVNYTEDGRIVGFQPVALPWTRPVAVAPPMSIVTVYATLPPTTVPADPEDGAAQPVPGDASVTCRVLVNGAVVKEDTARGPHATATCSASLDIDNSAPSPPAPSGAPGAPRPRPPTFFAAAARGRAQGHHAPARARSPRPRAVSAVLLGREGQDIMPITYKHM